MIFSQPSAEIPLWITVGVWAIGERILSLRGLRSGAWKSGQDRGSVLWIVIGVVGGFGAAFVLASRHTLSLPDPPSVRTQPPASLRRPALWRQELHCQKK